MTNIGAFFFVIYVK